MPAFINREGRKYGKLLVVSRAGKTKHNHTLWKCLCDCGNISFTSSLGKRKNTANSCGCIRTENIRRMGLASKKEFCVSRTPEYRKNIVGARRKRPEVAAHERISRMLCHALSNVNSVKSGRTFDLLGYTPHELKSHIERQFTPGMSWENRKDWQIDHIIPLSTAKNPEEVLKLNALSNLRPLWSVENNQKRNKRTLLL